MKPPITISRKGIAVEGAFGCALLFALAATLIAWMGDGFFWWYLPANIAAASAGYFTTQWRTRNASPKA